MSKQSMLQVFFLVRKKNKIVELNHSESKIVNKITEHIKAKGYNICCDNLLHRYHWLKNAKKKRSICNLFYPHLSTVHLSDVAVLTLASLTVLFVKTPCALPVDGSVPHQRTTYQFYQVSSQLSFAN